MNNYVAYHGYIQKNNIGDEAIYAGCKKLFPEFELIQQDLLKMERGHLFGGGTLLPQYENICKDVDSPIASVGVGVRNPEFRNKAYSSIDIGYLLGKRGISNGILRKKPVKFPLLALSNISESITAKPHYLTSNDFKKLKQFDYVGVRGPISKRILSKYDIPAEVTGDTALILEPDEYKDNRTNKIAITLRDRGVKWGNDTNYVNEVMDFCRSKSDKFDIVFVPLQPRDIPLHIKLSNKIPGSSMVDLVTHPDVKGVINKYAECDIVIGERLHASVLAACSYTPFLSLSYRPKNMDFSESVSMSDFTIKLGGVTEKWLNKKFEKSFNDDISHTLADNVQTHRDNLTEYTKKVSDLYNRSC